MKKFTFLMIAILVASMSFAQVLLKNGRTAYVPATKTTQTSPLAKLTRAEIFSEDFENGMPTGWATVDSDGDGFNWDSHINSGTGNHEAHSGDGILTSASYDNDNSVALTPDNWVITPAIELPATTDPIMLTFYVCAQDGSWAGEHYGVYISTGTNQTDLTSFVCLGQETLDGNGGSGLTRASGAYGEKNVDLTSYANQTVYIAFRHFDCTDMFYLNLDDVSINTLAACTTPMNPNTTDITYTSATLNWTGFNANYNVRYRVAEQDVYSFFDDFEGDLSNWTILREGEGTEYTDWRIFDPSGFSGGQTAHSGSQVAMSRSWSSSAYTVDNWLITPQISLQGTLKYWVMDDGEYHENYTIYVSTTTNEISAFEVLYTPGEASEEWVEHTVDLSSYNGQMGYLAIRHNDTDQDFLLIDDFGVVINSIPAGDWTTVSSTEATLALNNLESSTLYEWQVQGVCDGDETTEWTASVFFRTPMIVSVDAAEEIANIAVYPNPTKDMVTVANAEGKNIVIVNSLGQVVANIENAAANQTIDVANFANGTYFVKVDAEVVKLNVVK